MLWELVELKKRSGRYIYVLIEPYTQKVRYVGQTNCPERRLHEHVTGECASTKEWAAQLIALGTPPEMRVIASSEVDGKLFQPEVYHIAKYRREGCNLLNRDWHYMESTLTPADREEQRRKIRFGLNGMSKRPGHWAG
jgi:GIY-YIG catalytic domain